MLYICPGEIVVVLTRQVAVVLRLSSNLRLISHGHTPPLRDRALLLHRHFISLTAGDMWLFFEGVRYAWKYDNSGLPVNAIVDICLCT